MALSKEKILAGFCNEDDEVFDYIYSSSYWIVRNFVINNSGTEEDAEDIFQDTIIAIILKAKANGMKIKHSFKAYFIKACKNQWFKKLASRKVIVIDPSADSFLLNQYFEPDFELEQKLVREYRMFEKYINTLSKSCQKLFSLIIQGFKNDEIAQEMVFNDPLYVYKKKCVCMKTLGKRCRKDPNYNEIMCQ